MTPNEDIVATTGEAVKAVTSGRNLTYGEPEHNLQIFEDLVYVVVKAVFEREAKGYAPMNPGVVGSIIGGLMKTSRMIGGPTIQHDTLVDAVGYNCTLIRAENVGNHKKEEKANDKN